MKHIGHAPMLPGIDKRKPTEKSILLGIRSALTFKGWTVIKMPPSIYTSGKGVPDLLCTRWGITAWIEVKTETGRLSPQQKLFGEKITDAGGLYIVARSIDFAVHCLENIKYDMQGVMLQPKKGMRLIVQTDKGVIA